MKRPEIFKVILLVLIIFLFSTSFKILNLKYDTNFVDGDEIGYIQAANDLFHLFDEFDVRNIFFRLFRAFVFPEGPVYIFATFVWMLFLTFVKVPLTEFTLSLFHVFIGGLISVLVFLIGREFKNVKVGLVAALFFSILPISVGAYRFAGGNSQIASLLLTLTILLTLRWIKNKNSVWPVSLFLGLYLVSDNQFPAIFPLLFVIVLFYQTGNMLMRLKQTVKRLFNWRIWLILLVIQYPVLVTWAYFGFRGDWTTAITGHFFTQGIKISDIGLQLETIRGIILASGLILALMFIPSAVYGLIRLYLRKKEGLLFLWTFTYLAPWVFLLNLGSGYRLHFMQGIIPIILLMSDLSIKFFGKSIFKKILTTIFLMIVFIFTLSSTLDYVYNLKIGITPLLLTGNFSDVCSDTFQNRGPVCDSPPYCYVGSDYDNNWGLKTAGYFVRKNTALNDAVFSEVGVANAKHYFGRPVFSNQHIWKYGDGNITKKYSYLPQVENNISTVIVRVCNYPTAKEQINASFNKIATVQWKNQPVLYIFSKRDMPHKILSTEIYDPLFDKEYGNWKSQYLDDRLPYSGIDFNISLKEKFRHGFNSPIKAGPW